MRNAFKAILHVKFLVILIIAQFSIGIFLLNTSSYSNKEAKIKSTNIDRLFNIDSTYFIQISPPSDPNLTDPFAKIRKTYEEMESLKQEGLIKAIYLAYGGGIHPVSYFGENIPLKYENTLGRHLASVTVNKDFYEHYNLNISKGRGFTHNDFKINPFKENIPLILGEDYLDIVKLGDTFDFACPDFTTYEQVGIPLTYEVIGFYSHNDIPILGEHSDTLASDIVYSDAFGISPIVENITAIGYESQVAQHGAFVDIGISENLNVILERLKPIAQKDNCSISTKHIKDDFLTLKESLSKNIFSSKLLGFSLTLLSLIGVAAIMFGRIEERKKEFGIKIASGATKKTIMFEVFLENFLLCIGSTALALICIHINYKGLLSTKLIVSNLLLTILMVVLVSILPLLKIKKLNTIELLRR